MSSTKASKGDEIGLPLSGKLAELMWVKTSRKSPPSEKAALAGDVIYNVETADDIGRAFKRQKARK